MNRIRLISVLSDLYVADVVEYPGDLNVVIEQRLQVVQGKYEIDSKTISKIICDLIALNPSDSSARWKYMCLCFYVLFLLKDDLFTSQSEDILSVQQSKVIRDTVANLAGLGIANNLMLGVPYRKKLQTERKFPESDITPLTSYNRLLGTIEGLSICLKSSDFRAIIIPKSLGLIFAGFYQILYYPVKKGTTLDLDGHPVDEVLDKKMLQNRKHFLERFTALSNVVHITVQIQETMKLGGFKSVEWFQKAAFNALHRYVPRPNGIKNIAIAMFESSLENDDTKNWKIYQVLVGIILNYLKTSRDHIFYELLELVTENDRLMFDRIFANVTRSLYKQDEQLCKAFCLKPLFERLMPFVEVDEFKKREDVTKSVAHTVRIFSCCFVESGPYEALPLNLLNIGINILFRIYSIIFEVQQGLSRDLKELIVAFLKSSNENYVYDNFLFDFKLNDCFQLRPDLSITFEDNCLLVDVVDYSVAHSITRSSQALLALIENDVRLATNYFLYLLNCLNTQSRYLGNNNASLLKLEPSCISDGASRLIAIHHNINILIQKREVQKLIFSNPEEIMNYLNDSLLQSIFLGHHKITDFDSHEFESLFLMVMILQILLLNSFPQKETYKFLLQPLEIISNETTHEELKLITGDILKSMNGPKIKLEKSAVDQAFDEVVDPMLPVRAHGLMTLAKLIENKDKSALEKKQSIMLIFKQHLNDSDSYVYLSAIEGLQVMGNIFPESVLATLTEEYVDCSRKSDDSSQNARLKVGEVLVRITRKLGDMAPKHKSILLNAFLAGCKDDDFLVRASSLSNLGEVCQVLGHKVGTILAEILMCVHTVIATDKSVEARRAAVTVLRQLFAGSKSDMIATLQDEILVIYRTLTHMYRNDQDDVMRLQAQLALEELNENMKEFVLPKLPVLNPDKSPIVMK